MIFLADFFGTAIILVSTGIAAVRAVTLNINFLLVFWFILFFVFPFVYFKGNHINWYLRNKECEIISCHSSCTENPAAEGFSAYALGLRYLSYNFALLLAFSWRYKAPGARN